MNWFLGIIAVLVLIFLINNYYRKKRFKDLKVTLQKNWGKQKENEYFNFYVIKQYFENNFRKNQFYHQISERTSVDLDIDELFKFIDRTSSKIG